MFAGCSVAKIWCSRRSANGASVVRRHVGQVVLLLLRCSHGIWRFDRYGFVGVLLKFLLAMLYELEVDDLIVAGITIGGFPVSSS